MVAHSPPCIVFNGGVTVWAIHSLTYCVEKTCEDIYHFGPIRTIQCTRSSNEPLKGFFEGLLNPNQNLQILLDITNLQDLSNFVVFEGWDINQDEIVRRIDLSTQREFEKYVENDVFRLFSLLKLNGTKVPAASTKKPDYQADGVDFEVTAIRTYIPRTPRIDKALGEMSKIFGKCHHVYMFLDRDLRPDIRIMGTEDCDKNGSILCMKQDITLYYLEIINKINEKYLQDSVNASQVIVIDFREAPFDSVILKKGIHSLLNKRGYDYPSLMGIVAVVPENIDSGLFEPPNYFFVENMQYKGTSNKAKQRLLEIANVKTSVAINPMAILITKDSSKPFSAQNPCVNVPSLREIRRIITPEIIYEQLGY